MSKKIFAAVVIASLLSACSQPSLNNNPLIEEAHIEERTRAGDILINLPPPSQKIAVSVYDFQDQTGQFKNNEKYTDYSSAVTKGGHAILTKALMDAGDQQWFDVAERGGLKNLLQERQIIKIMRSEYLGPNGSKLEPLPPLLYGGILLEGGIISYDSNVLTGGIGAMYLGIGGSTQYHRDLVSVYLRAVNVQTGRVMLAVTSSKTVYSTAVDANVLKYISFDKLFQAEAGFSINEPTNIAVRQAIETAVYAMIMEGARKNLWSFADSQAGQSALADYQKRLRSSNPQN